VIQDGLDGSNQKWIIQVQPDGPLLRSNPQNVGGAPNGSIAVQIDAAFSTAVMSATAGSLFPFLNNGNNPFNVDDAISEGVVFSGNNVYAALGTDIVNRLAGDANADNKVDDLDFAILANNWDPLQMNAPVGGGIAAADFNNSTFVDDLDFAQIANTWTDELWLDAVNVTTTGGGGTVSWGGRTVLDGTDDQFTSARVAQAGSNFDGLVGNAGAGSLSAGGGAVPEPASLFLVLCGALMLGGGRRIRR
jgi:hypothetical protein